LYKHGVHDQNQGGKGARGQRGKEARRQGGEGARRQGGKGARDGDKESKGTMFKIINKPYSLSTEGSKGRNLCHATDPRSQCHINEFRYRGMAILTIQDDKGIGIWTY